jgi:hypothetical protein
MNIFQGGYDNTTSASNITAANQTADYVRTAAPNVSENIGNSTFTHSPKLQTVSANAVTDCSVKHDKFRNTPKSPNPSPKLSKPPWSVCALVSVLVNIRIFSENTQQRVTECNCRQNIGILAIFMHMSKHKIVKLISERPTRKQKQRNRNQKWGNRGCKYVF